MNKISLSLVLLQDQFSSFVGAVDPLEIDAAAVVVVVDGVADVLVDADIVVDLLEVDFFVVIVDVAVVVVVSERPLEGKNLKYLKQIRAKNGL